MALAETLQRAALNLARASAGIDPVVVDAHLAATRDGRRLLCIEIGVCAGRLFLTAATIPTDTQDGSGQFELLTLKQRQDRLP